ncbi:non-ribosomal peptide synthetase [Tahibacter sp.]|uniref:non-ribosomal peptide synthetase n=1 Tax=Tahibacter sp. TaxID=2056211 RepID=UPI0028C3D4C6|nr:non-ribosomal peptide synthetase [Tahibacter sp.]
MSSRHDVSELTPQQLQALADRLLRQRKTAAAPTASIPDETPTALSYAQEALWLVERLGTGVRAYNETMTLRLEGELDVGALERSLSAVVQRHGALRARIDVSDDGSPHQVIEPARPITLEVLDRPDIDDDGLHAELHALADRAFDLAQPPLFRATLVRISPRSHVLLWNVHHIVWDEWSVQLFLIEFGAHYAAFVQGQPGPGLAPVALQYVDFVAWQRGHMTQQSLEQQRAYWRGCLAGAPALLTLPIDRARPARRTFLGGNHYFELPVRVATLLEATSRAAGATLYMTLLALYQVLLARLSGSADIVVRSPTSGRTHPQVAGVIGLFVNMLPLRNIIHGDVTFATQLDQVRLGTLDALGNQTFPYEWLVAELVRTRDLSYEPIAQVDFVLREEHEAGGTLPGIAVLPLETLHSGAINDLTWIARPDAGGMRCEFVYATDLFDPVTVQEFGERLIRLARSVVDEPAVRLEQIDLRLPYDEAVARARYPLTAVQQIRWRQIDDAAATTVPRMICVIVELAEAVDPVRLAQAANALSARTEALRLRFEAVAPGRVLQQVAAAVPVELSQVDVSVAPDVEAAATAAIEAFARCDAGILDAAAFDGLLVKLGDARFRLGFRYHPLALDSAQADALTRQCLADYASASPVAAPGGSLRRHWHVETEWYYGPRSGAAQDFWRSVLADSVAVTFAAGSSRQPLSAPVRIGGDLPAALTDAIGAYAGAVDCSVADLMFALIALYVQRATGTQRPRVGSSVTIAAAHDVVAATQAFVPVVVVAEAAAAVGANVQSVLAQRRQSTGYARDYAPLQAGLLADDEEAFRVAIDVEGGTPEARGGVQVQAADRHDLTISYGLDDAGRCIGLSLHAYPGQHQVWELESVLAALTSFLRSVCTATPALPLQRADMMTAQERERLLAQVCAPQCVDVGTEWVHEQFTRQACLTPDAVAVRIGTQEITYAQLEERSNRFAGYLVRRGVGADCAVGLFLERSIELLVAILGTLKAGGAYLPIDTESPDARIAYVLGNSKPTLLITTAAFAQRLKPVVPDTLICAIDSVDFSGSPITPVVRVHGEQLAYVMYTSGSTGQPKGVEISHAALLNCIAWMQAEYGLGAGDRVLQKTPYTFDFSVWELLWPLMTGARLVLARPGGHRDAEYLYGLIRSEGITLTHFVPSMLAAFLTQAPTLDCPSLRHVTCGGEALPAALVERFFAAHAGARLHNLYGPTEATIQVSYFECLRESASSGVPIGRPMWNTRLYVLDEQLQPVPLGFIGELYISGACVARGYRNRPDLTADRFVADPFAGTATARMYRTGDFARYRADGLLDFLGRCDQQVKIRGVRIELGEIEALLAQHASVKQAVVRPLARDGDVRLVGYVIPRDGMSVSPDVLRMHLKQHLPESMLPSAFVSLAAWPVTANGKLDHRSLPAPDAGTQSAREYEPPQSGTEASLASIWSQLLGVERVGRRDNFFELGGHSLLGMQAIARVRARLEVPVPFEAMFECRDLEALARRIDAIRWSRETDENSDDDVGNSRERLVF